MLETTAQPTALTTRLAIGKVPSSLVSLDLRPSFTDLGAASQLELTMTRCFEQQRHRQDEWDRRPGI
jgi:hypothetical protein